ncbi:MAG: bacillithiol biosynthesis deacetylase BshB1 [Acidobacteria bacterium]|nr:bacillithiol biosynthesis deacetylase BshB1 [Acidobacteriota bacterium]
MRLDIIAFGAHPDDVELFAGGTLAKMASLGYSTGIVDMSRGELGTRGNPETRREEAGRAAEILKVQVRENLGFSDGEMTVTPEARLKIIKILRKYRPPIVLTHYWDDRHPDHVNTSRLVTEAVHHSGLAKIDTGQHRYRPPTILYFKVPSYIVPTFIVDVSDFVERRNAAIQAYRSQLYNPSSTEPMTRLSHPEFLANVETVHSYYGTLIGKRAGEAFHLKGIMEVHDLVSQFTVRDTD